MDMDNKKWNELGYHVLQELERLNTNLAIQQENFNKLQIWATREIAILQVKAGFWGLLGGAIVFFGEAVLRWMQTKST